MPAKQTLLIDHFQPSGAKVPLKILENDTGAAPSVVDGVTVLARVVGEGFLVDGISSNGRYYSRSLWEKVIRDFHEGTGIEQNYFGALGHDVEINEVSGRAGEIASKLHDIRIEEIDGKSVGIVEILILGTDSGHNLNKLLRAPGARIPVSSRAMGTWDTREGIDFVNVDDFCFFGIDHVFNPGVKTALPVVVESDQTALPAPIKEDKKMDEKQLQLITEKADLNAELKVTAFKLTESEKKLADVNEALKAKDAEIKLLQEKVSAERELVEAETKKVVEAAAKIAEWEAIGTQESLKVALTLTEAYTELGKPEEITEKLAKARRISDAFLKGKRLKKAAEIAAKYEVNKEGVFEALTKLPSKEVEAFFAKSKEAKNNVVKLTKPSNSGTPAPVPSTAGKVEESRMGNLFKSLK